MMTPDAQQRLEETLEQAAIAGAGGLNSARGRLLAENFRFQDWLTAEVRRNRNLDDIGALVIELMAANMAYFFFNLEANLPENRSRRQELISATCDLLGRTCLRHLERQVVAVERDIAVRN